MTFVGLQAPEFGMPLADLVLSNGHILTVTKSGFLSVSIHARRRVVVELAELQMTPPFGPTGNRLMLTFLDVTELSMDLGDVCPEEVDQVGDLWFHENGRNEIRATFDQLGNFELQCVFRECKAALVANSNDRRSRY